LVEFAARLALLAALLVSRRVVPVLHHRLGLLCQVGHALGFLAKDFLLARTLKLGDILGYTELEVGTGRFGKVLFQYLVGDALPVGGVVCAVQLLQLANGNGQFLYLLVFFELVFDL
jgi:hypothetical protein